MSFGIPVRNGLSIGIGTLVSLTSGSGVGGRSRRPALYFDFLTTTSLDSRITFSRGTNATLVDATGRVTYAPNNLLTNSESFEASAWNKSGATVTANSTAAPDGTTTADKLVETTTNAQHRVSQAVTVTSGISYTYTIYAKAAERTSVWVRVIGTTTFAGCVVDLTTGAITSTTGTCTAEALNNGWYRISITGTSDSTTATVYANLVQGTSTTTYTGDGTSGAFIWGAQLEAVTYQTTPGTYNSTTPKNLLGFTQEFDNAAWTKSNAFVQTNLLTWSEQFDNAFWAKTNATVTANSTAAPDGTNTADNLVEDTSTGLHRVFATPACAANTTYTFTAYVKAAGRTQVRLAETTLGGAYFDLSAGTVLSFDAGVTASIQNVGSGWYRCRITSTTGAAQTLYVAQIQGATGGNNSYTGNGAAALSLWGAQLVQGADAGDYQLTTAAAAPVQYAAPDGTLSAEALQETTATGLHLAQQFFTFASGVPYTVSAYVKAGSRTWVQLLLPGAAFTASQGGFFNLTGDGSLGTATGTPTARSITAVGNGWYRISVTATSTAAAGGNIPIVAASADGTTSYAGSDTSPALFVWGAQLSNSASLDPYVYNPAAAPTSAAYYGPRFDYNPVTLAPRGLLIEEQRTNRTLNSEDFTAATWVATIVGTSTRVNDGAPLGFTRGLITATSATGGIRQVHSGLTSGQVYALSFYIQSTATSVQIVFENGTAQFGSSHNVTINPSNGTAGVLTGFTSVSIQPFGPGYVYTLITAPAGGALAANIEWRITNSGNSIWLGRPQFEAGTFATSYIPTVASQVTRNADVAQMLGANFSNWYNQTEGTFVVEAVTQKPTSLAAASDVVSVNDGTTSNRALVRFLTGNVEGLNVTGGAVVAQLSQAYTPNSVDKLAFAIKANDFAFARNGSLVGFDTSGAMPVSVDRLSIGGPSALNGHIRTLAYYNTRLSNSQLQALTV